MTFRRSDTRAFSRKVKSIAFERSKDAAGIPRCCMAHGFGCGAPLRPGHFIYDHIEPWEIGRDSRIENCELLCDTCDAVKTETIDQPMIAKSNRVRDRHRDAFERSRMPMPCGRHSSRSRTMRGRVVRRLTGAEKHRRAMAGRKILAESD